MKVIRIGQKIIVEHLGMLIPALVIKRWKEFTKVKNKHSLLAFVAPGRFIVVFPYECRTIPEIIVEYAELIGMRIPNWARIN